MTIIQVTVDLDLPEQQAREVVRGAIEALGPESFREGVLRPTLPTDPAELRQRAEECLRTADGALATAAKAYAFLRDQRTVDAIGAASLRLLPLLRATEEGVFEDSVSSARTVDGGRLIGW